MGKGFRLGSILGFEIRIDYSWFVIFFLVLWSLTAGFFPQTLPERPTGVYLAMGTAGTLSFFASLLAHRPITCFRHALIALPVEMGKPTDWGSLEIAHAPGKQAEVRVDYVSLVDFFP